MQYKRGIFHKWCRIQLSFWSSFGLFFDCFCWWHRLLLLGKQWQTLPNTFASAASEYLCVRLHFARDKVGFGVWEWCQDWWFVLNDTWLSVWMFLPLHIQYCQGLQDSYRLSVILCSRHAFYGRLAKFCTAQRHARWNKNKFAYGIWYMVWRISPTSQDAADTEWDKWWQVCRPICALNRLKGATHIHTHRLMGHNQFHPSSMAHTIKFAGHQNKMQHAAILPSSCISQMSGSWLGDLGCGIRSYIAAIAY